MSDSSELSENEPLRYTEYDTRLGAYCVILREGEDGTEILLALWNEAATPLWTLPGGGVDLEEHPEQGAVREVLEETGYHVTLDELLGIDTVVAGPEAHPRDADRSADRPLKKVRVFYAATITSGELTKEIGGSTDEAAWHRLTDVAGLDKTPMVAIALGMSGR